MNINTEIKELSKVVNKSNIENTLIKNIIKYLGGEQSPLRTKISLSNQYEIDSIKEDLLVNTLKVSKKEANTITERVLNTLSNNDSIQRCLVK